MGRKHVTAQAEEILIYEGEETSMTFCPPFPEDHPRIKTLRDDEIRPSGRADDDFVFSTACWRGYIGTWEIKDGHFYLVRIVGQHRLEGDEPLFADWFSGALRIPKGRMLEYVHMGFGSVFEQETHIKIENGIVTKTKTIDNRGKQHDPNELGWSNLPGMENRFHGDDDF